MKKNHFIDSSVCVSYEFNNLSNKWEFYAKVKILMSIFIAIVFLGCNNTQVQPEQKDSVQKIAKHKPLWIDNPFMDGYVVGVGSSKHKNISFRKKIALAMARANLAQAIKVETKVSTKISVNENSSTENIEQVIEEKAKELLVGSEIDDTFQDTDGTYYVFVILNKQNIR